MKCKSCGLELSNDSEKCLMCETMVSIEGIDLELNMPNQQTKKKKETKVDTEPLNNSKRNAGIIFLIIMILLLIGVATYGYFFLI